MRPNGGDTPTIAFFVDHLWTNAKPQQQQNENKRMYTGHKPKEYPTPRSEQEHEQNFWWIVEWFGWLY